MPSSHSPILPGSTIGILGGGQLGRMLAMAARQMGYRTAVLDPAPGAPAAQVADVTLSAAYHEEDALDELAAMADVVTVEFENIPAASLHRIAGRTLLRPSAEAVAICQNREREKNWLLANGFPCPRFTTVSDPAELDSAAANLGLPCVLKTAAFGYDGKGQQKISAPPAGGDWAAVWDALDAPRGILEEWVDFQCELSVLCARSPEGVTVAYDPAENLHSHHILESSTVPARIPPTIRRRAQDLALSICDALGFIGLLGVELFLTRDGGLLVNELAPRTHNSGHHTLDACATSQFEQQLRAICGLPLGSTRLLSPAKMTNLLGDRWLDSPTGHPDWNEILSSGPDVHLHLYGKSAPARRRKMGHFTTLLTHPVS
ncbi:5-(carboxyamino)imidazole ribonucleotide synthase [soil metagenome]